MNNLSWLIYWADAAPNVAQALCVISALTFLASTFFVVVGFTGCFGDEAKVCDEKHYNWGDYKYAATLAPRCRKLWPLPVVCLLVWSATFLVPSKDTFYLIAASEIGEQAIETPEFTKVRAVINKWLDGEVEGDTPETTDAAE